MRDQLAIIALALIRLNLEPSRALCLAPSIHLLPRDSAALYAEPNDRGQLEPESRSRQIQQCYIRLFLHSFQDDFTAIRGNIECADIEVGREVC